MWAYKIYMRTPFTCATFSPVLLMSHRRVPRMRSSAKSIPRLERIPRYGDIEVRRAQRIRTPERSLSCDDMEARRSILENEGTIGRIAPHSVFCRACNRDIALHQRYKYYIHNWVQHAATKAHQRLAKGYNKNDGYVSGSEAMSGDDDTAMDEEQYSRIAETPQSDIIRYGRTIRSYSPGQSGWVKADSVPVLGRGGINRTRNEVVTSEDEDDGRARSCKGRQQTPFPRFDSLSADDGFTDSESNRQDSEERLSELTIPIPPGVTSVTLKYNYGN